MSNKEYLKQVQFRYFDKLTTIAGFVDMLPDSPEKYLLAKHIEGFAKLLEEEGIEVIKRFG